MIITYPKGLSQAFQQKDHDHRLSAKIWVCIHAALTDILQKTCPGTKKPAADDSINFN